LRTPGLARTVHIGKEGLSVRTCLKRAVDHKRSDDRDAACTEMLALIRGVVVNANVRKLASMVMGSTCAFDVHLVCGCSVGN
jgi:hypothetical protein